MRKNVIRKIILFVSIFLAAIFLALLLIPIISACSYNTNTIDYSSSPENTFSAEHVIPSPSHLNQKGETYDAPDAIMPWVMTERQFAEQIAKQYVQPNEYKLSEVIDETEAMTCLSSKRRTVFNAALSILNEVPYFWGGKTKYPYKNLRWGVRTLVTSKGSETTGTYQPLGLDCSGYVSWCFMHLGLDWEAMREKVGDGTLAQWNLSAPIGWSELQVGDLVFQYSYPEAAGNHVGICIGFDRFGIPYFAHSSFSLGGVVITPAGDVFKYARRPFLFDPEA
ncbi:MAG: C40 family peptidase [Clostridia bacterium]|nr:C40 family peptidase [Clostridia bacterium]